MKINKKSIGIFLLLAGLLVLTVSSQIFQPATISIEDQKDCITTYYNETVHTYGNVTNTRNTYGLCTRNFTYIFINNQTNVNETRVRYYNQTCTNGTEPYQSYERISSRLVLKNKTDCRVKSYIVSITKGSVTEKKEIDFSSWGVCVNSTENGCLAITCGTLQGGSARNGIFNGCDGGKSCQKFLFCQDEIKTLYKASSRDFVYEDPTFQLNRLALKEVGQ